jgi:RND family efflux transporter MFP subunit
MIAPAGQKRLYLVGSGAVLAALAGALALGAARAREQRAASPAGGRGWPPPRALVATARPGPAWRNVEVQGEARPFASVTLYAKVSGYLRAIQVDRGDRVEADQVLAVIQSPEIDRQHQAALADAAYKRASARSAEALTGPGAISRRQLELEKTSAEVADAVLAGIETQKSFTILRAPFRGTITARFADPGALVQNAANAQGGALPVVTVSQTERLRVFTYLDQRSAQLVRIGDEAVITVPESGATVAGTVSRSNGELDPRTRTMLVEVHLDNTQGTILPGSFVRVQLKVKAPSLLEVPAEALILRGAKPFLAVVKPDNRLEVRPVAVGRFEGPTVGIASGLAANEHVALNLGRSASTGDTIDPVSWPVAPSKP